MPHPPGPGGLLRSLAPAGRLLPAVVAVLLYLPFLGGPYFMDSNHSVRKDRDYPASLVTYLTRSWWGPNLARPVTRTSFWLGHRAAEGMGWRSPADVPSAFHRSFNVLLLAAAGLALSALLAELRAPRPTLLASAWVAHPLLSFATQYVVQRSVLLCALFSFLGVRSYVRGQPGRAGLFLLLALGSKEIGAVAWFACLLLPGSRATRTVLAVACAALITVGLVQAGRAIELGEAPNKGYTLASRLAAQPGAILGYVRAMVWPVPSSLSLNRSMAPVPVSVAGLVLLAGAALAAAVAHRRDHPWLLVALAAFGPESGPFLLEPRFDHRAILPLGWLVVSAGVALRDRRPDLGPAPVAGLLVLCLGASLAWLPLWRDKASLHGHAVALEPGSWRAHADYANGLLVRSRAPDAARRALEHLGTADGLHPGHPNTRLLMAVAHRRLGEFDRSLELARSVAGKTPYSDREILLTLQAMHEAGVRPPPALLPPGPMPAPMPDPSILPPPRAP